ncbi:MAG: four helix bundle protein [Pyrinomonadaceae bacterium]
MRPHHQLDVWKKAVDVSVAIYRCTDGFPRDERSGLTSQLRRAAVSIAANIAEGAARKSSREFVNFLSIAQGSASEVETELIIARRLNYLSEAEFGELTIALDEIGRMITGLSSYLKARSTDPT